MTPQFARKSGQSLWLYSRRAQSYKLFVVSVFVVLAAIVVFWAVGCGGQSQDDDSEIGLVLSEYIRAWGDGETDAIQSMMGPGGIQYADRILDAALHDSREQLQRRDPYEMVEILRARQFYTATELRQLTADDFTEWLLREGFFEGDPQIERLEISDGVAWVSLVVEPGGFRVEGEFFAFVAGEWKIEHWILNREWTKTLLPPMPDPTVEQIEELFSEGLIADDDAPREFDERMWDGPID